MAHILIVDDEANIRSSLKNALDKRGHECVTADSFAQGQQFARAEFDLILLDVLLGDGSGLDLLKEILTHRPESCVVMISGHADIDTAVQAIQTGAYDFVEKPLSLDRILITIDNATRTSRLVSEKNRLAGIVYGDLLGESELIKQVRADIMRSAPRARRFLILGENGTGKTTLFNAICGTIDYHSGIIDLPGYLKLLRSYQQPRWQSGSLREHLQAENIDETRFRQILGVLNVEGEIFDRPLESFSEGQLKKVDLCQSFMSPAHLLLWDEPLNYIDILSREQIEQVILDFRPTLLFIEHDKYFVDKVATDVVVMDREE